MVNIQILQGGTGKKQRFNMRLGATFEDVQKEVDRFYGGDRQFNVVYKGKDIRKYGRQTLDVPDDAKFYLAYHVHGGVFSWVTANCMIELTRQTCAQMECGHTMSSNGMQMYAEHLAESGRYKVVCPQPNCNRIWSLSDVRSVTGYNQYQFDVLEQKLDINEMEISNGMRKCPRCSNLCQRLDINNPRIICAVCNPTYEFCWRCVNTWVGSGTSCQHPDCIDLRTQVNNCENKSIPYCDVSAPCKRLCPNQCCGVLIQHESMCKQVMCKRCLTDFCFVCLTPTVNKRLQCGSYNVKCPVASKQRV